MVSGDGGERKKSPSSFFTAQREMRKPNCTIERREDKNEARRDIRECTWERGRGRERERDV